jgi:hypothetical protein
MTAQPPSDSAPPPVPHWVVATSTAGTVGIATGAFWLSFTALEDLASRAGIAPGEAWVWPLIIDGIVVVSTTSVVALSPHGRRATIYPWILLTAGTTISVAANSAHALLTGDSTIAPGLAAAVAAMPPLVQLAMTHLTVELTKRTRSTSSSTIAIEPSELVARASVPRARPAPKRVMKPLTDGRREQALAFRQQGWSNSKIARELRVHPSTVGRWFGPQPARVLAPLPSPSPRTTNKSTSREL